MLDRRLYTCCFTGHRELEPDCLERLPALLDRRLAELVGRDFYIFVAGGAQGFDMLAAEAVLRLKERRPVVRLGLVLPCADQAHGWGAATRRRYERLACAADELDILQQNYTPGCMRRRNAELVARSSLCLAYCLRERSGAGQTVAMALRAGIAVENLADEH